VGFLAVHVLLSAQTFSCSLPGDVNGSASIDIGDALLIARAYVGLISSFPCQSTTGPTAGPTGVCTNLGPAPAAVNESFTGNPFTGSRQVVVETDPGLPRFTVFRTKVPGPGKNYPILAWGQGGCSTDHLSNPEFNGEFASHGYLRSGFIAVAGNTTWGLYRVSPA
jgi:hypothetical protein